ncbi:MAG: 1-acyl-sn-glycerol-3-phosphate acyltransferase [Oculatellaceae cyanobacterium Prado106]|jgi:1-acyl-sn-glycerol-3-phosphate acyltransferase|nr:1-acyl-sn-glycerol-3-phosphate acyltransferase [Oculatellaceae cyanobacterium Prado106]
MALFQPSHKQFTSTAPTASITQIKSRISPWLTPLAYLLGQVVIPVFFRRVRVIGLENVPKVGATMVAPTHRSRWDGILLAHILGRRTTGRDIHFMVTENETKGFQGWFVERLGGFPINPKRPAIASIRHGVEILQNQEMMVIFPEGGIYRDGQVHDLKSGLARLALQAESSRPGLEIKIVPITLHYTHEVPDWGCEVTVRIGEPIETSQYIDGNIKQNSKALMAELETALKGLNAMQADPTIATLPTPAHLPASPALSEELPADLPYPQSDSPSLA